MERRTTTTSAPPPPRTLNVSQFAEARAPELQSLHSIISNRVNNNFKSKRNKRRRTTGFDNRSNKKRRRKSSQKKEQGDDDDDDDDDEKKKSRPVPRRVRRRIELRKNLECGFATSGDGTKRLPTHLWHAKRFTMAKKWGYFLPIGLSGRGKGSRALLKWFKNGALLHDASYNSVVQLEGPEDSLLSVLRMVLVPTSSSVPQQLSTSPLTGNSFGIAMLHHVGAPFSQLISPVTYMWRPLSRDKVEADVASDHITSGSISSSSTFPSSPFRQLWVWIHAGALNEGISSLRLACQKEREETGININCISREGQLAKLEVMGSKAIQILQKILHPVAGTSTSSFDLVKCSARTCPQLQRSFILEHAVHLPAGAILSLTVKDPRDLPNERPGSFPEAASNILEGDVTKDESHDHSALNTFPDQNKHSVSSLWSNPDANSVLYSDSKDLWENHRMSPPVDENLLCMEKHQKRMDFFHLDKNSGMSSTQTKEQYSRSCSILLLKKCNLQGSCVRWDIILPLSWIKAFWLPIINHGAHVVGLRERRWIACDVGLPSFPYDFPDCRTYSCFMAAEAVASDEKMDLRPMAMRPLSVPISPPWHSIRQALVCGHAVATDIKDIGEKCSTSQNNKCQIMGDGESASSESEIREQDGDPFEGIISRTSSILSSHLNETHEGHLLLCPKKPKGQSAQSVDSGDKILLAPKEKIHLPLERKLCFVRVLLSAYEEGSFEDGSVVCAPHLADILLWTSRSDGHEGRLQIPQSLIGSYYSRQACGKWELQKPEDSVTRESHRWPIGFVTTGFVRGSIKPTAVAFCEATLLAQLRKEQWEGKEGKQKRSGIFVLVRNLRSASYRLAVGIIVLERHGEDVEFM